MGFLHLHSEAVQSILSHPVSTLLRCYIHRSNPTYAFPKGKDNSTGRRVLYKMVARHSYSAQGLEDLNFKEGDILDILSEGSAFLMGGTEWHLPLRQ